MAVAQNAGMVPVLQKPNTSMTLQKLCYKPAFNKFVAVMCCSIARLSCMAKQTSCCLRLVCHTLHHGVSMRVHAAAGDAAADHALGGNGIA